MRNEHAEVIYLPSLFSLFFFFCFVCAREEARRGGYCKEEKRTGLISVGEMYTLTVSYHCTWVEKSHSSADLCFIFHRNE